MNDRLTCPELPNIIHTSPYERLRHMKTLSKRSFIINKLRFRMKIQKNTKTYTRDRIVDSNIWNRTYDPILDLRLAHKPCPSTFCIFYSKPVIGATVLPMARFPLDVCTGVEPVEFWPLRRTILQQSRLRSGRNAFFRLRIYLCVNVCIVVFLFRYPDVLL